MQQHTKTKNTTARKVAFLGILAALAIVFSFLESMIPLPSFMPPGVKLGLSNIAILITGIFFSYPFGVTIILIKALFILLTRGLTASLLSFCGGLIAFTAMYLLIFFLKKISFIGVCVIGAFLNSSVQLLVAILITGTPSLWYYYPLMIIFSIITGVITGIIMKILVPQVRKIIPETKKERNAVEQG